MPTFTTEALHLVSNIQLAKFLLINGYYTIITLLSLGSNSQCASLLRPCLSTIMMANVITKWKSRIHCPFILSICILVNYSYKYTCTSLSICIYLHHTCRCFLLSFLLLTSLSDSLSSISSCFSSQCPLLSKKSCLPGIIWARLQQKNVRFPYLTLNFWLEHTHSWLYTSYCT